MLQTIAFRTLYQGNTSKRSFDVAIAWSLSAPRTSIDESLAVNDTDNRIVIVHKVRTRNESQPVTNLSTLSCSALCRKGISLAFVSDERGMYETGVKRCRCKGIAQHYDGVKSVRTHTIVAP